MRLVQGQMGHFLADHAGGPDRGSHRPLIMRPRSAFDAMMQMRKIDIAAIEARRG